MVPRFACHARSLVAGLLVCLCATANAADSDLLGSRGKVILQQNCGRCHAVEVTGESPLKQAPPMRDIYARFDPRELQAELKEGMVSKHRAIRRPFATPSAHILGIDAAGLGGDEFAILLHSASASEAVAAAHRVTVALNGKYELDQYGEANVGVSIGIACAPAHANEPEALLSLADKALYAAKAPDLEFLVCTTII
jgi:hypothetical protein